jgi:hypothetical protein
VRANDAPITTKAEALDVLTNIIEGLGATDAYHSGETDQLLYMMQEDVKQYLIGQLVLTEKIGEFVRNLSRMPTNEDEWDDEAEFTLNSVIISARELMADG